MRFLVDAQLPRRLARLLGGAGHDAIHTLELEAGNLTSDAELTKLADVEARVVITKDSDFVDSFLITGAPARLLLISTGNITNQELEKLIFPRLSAIVTALGRYHFVELTSDALIIHE